MSLFQIMMVAALMLGGLGVALLGSVKVPLAARLRIDEARVGGLVSLFGFSMIPVILSAGFMTDLVGRDIVFLSGCCLMAGSIALLGLAPRYVVAVIAVVLFSAAWSMLINVANVLTPLAFPGATGADTAHATNLANVFFGLGAFLTPLGVPWLVRRTSLPAGLAVVALLALLPAGLALMITMPTGQAASGDAGTAATFTDLLGEPMLWLCGFGLFFYGPLEASLAAWATTYLGEQGVKEQTAAGLLSGFWLSYMLSRLATAFALPSGREAVLIIVMGVLAALVLLAMVRTRRPALAMPLVPAAGLCLGPIFPTLMGILLGSLPENVHGRAVGVFFAIGGIGWTLLPIALGAYARRTSIRRAFFLAVFLALGLSLAGVALAWRRGL